MPTGAAGVAHRIVPVPEQITYDERLGVPLRWWVQGTMLTACVWLALVVALPPIAAWGLTAAFLALTASLLISYGNARITVRDGELRAGRARIETGFLGPATSLDEADTRRVSGVDADARAFLLLRPYLKRSVRVELTDPDDPTPYWLLSTRHPDRLAASLAGSAGVGGRRSGALD